MEIEKFNKVKLGHDVKDLLTIFTDNGFKISVYQFVSNGLFTVIKKIISDQADSVDGTYSPNMIYNHINYLAPDIKMQDSLNDLVRKVDRLGYLLGMDIKYEFSALSNICCLDIAFTIKNKNDEKRS